MIVNAHVFPHTGKKKSDCKQVCVTSVSTSTHGAQKVRHSRCVSTKHGNARMYPHKSTRMARERGCVSSSHHHRAWKRVGVKHVFFSCVSWRLKSVAICSCFSRSGSSPLFLPETLHIPRSKLKNDMQQEKRNLPESHDNLRTTLQKK